MKALKYSDITLIPKKSLLESRSDADVSAILGGKKFKAPVVPANMKSVIDESLAEKLSNADYFYIMHRFGISNLQFCKMSQNWKTVSISVGVKADDFREIEYISGEALRVDFITIDIAHGHSHLVKKMIEHIAKHLPESFIIAGNVATAGAVDDLASWGADAVKVGIGQGHVCSTKDKTGFTIPMFSCVLDCVKSNSKIPIIADGGLRCNGDIAKALCAGAVFCMAGSLFAGCLDSPGSLAHIDGKSYKQYFGSASEYNKGHKKHIEGIVRQVPLNGMSFEEKLEEIQEDLQSSISYGGGDRLSCITSVDWMEV
jgi:GMP reductase